MLRPVDTKIDKNGSAWRSCPVEGETTQRLEKLQDNVTSPVLAVRTGLGPLNIPGDRGLLQGEVLSTLNLCGCASLPAGLEERASPQLIFTPRTAGAAIASALLSLSSPPTILWSWDSGMEGDDAL